MLVDRNIWISVDLLVLVFWCRLLGQARLMAIGVTLGIVGGIQVGLWLIIIATLPTMCSLLDENFRNYFLLISFCFTADRLADHAHSLQ